MRAEFLRVFTQPRPEAEVDHCYAAKTEKCIGRFDKWRLSRFRQTFNSASSPALIVHGTNDTTVPVEKASELNDILTNLSIPHAFYMYPAAEHRFDRDKSAANDAAAESAWGKTSRFCKVTYISDLDCSRSVGHFWPIYHNGISWDCSLSH